MPKFDYVMRSPDGDLTNFTTFLSLNSIVRGRQVGKDMVFFSQGPIVDVKKIPWTGYVCMRCLVSTKDASIEDVEAQRVEEEINGISKLKGYICPRDEKHSFYGPFIF